MSEPSPAVTAKAAAFDVNEGADAVKGYRFPSMPENTLAIDIGGYAKAFESMLGSDDPMLAAAKALGVESPKYTSAKALGTPPTAFNFGRLSYAPDATTNGGVMQWPGINPDSLRKIVRENVAPQLVLGMRVDDVLRYSNHAKHIWKPGWHIEAVDTEDNDKANIKKDIAEATRFIQNSNIETSYTEVRKRDSKRLTGFQKFLAAGTRDWLTFDMLAIWTDMDMKECVKGYALLPAGNIRLCTTAGYENDPDKYAVAVDEGGRVIQAFTRDELTIAVRNPRTDPDVFGYGYPEVEMAMRIIKGFQNAIDLNCGVFDKSSIAQGILTVSGGAITQRQIDLLTRMFTNMQKGISKWWALPVMGLPDGAKLELLDLTRLKGNESFYNLWMNMLAGALATLWRFPVRRLGYKVSGTQRDNEPLPDSSIAAVDEDDPGLAPLLTHWEVVINEYLIATRWPHLRFAFTGKTPKEDARQFAEMKESRTWKEARAENGLPPLAALVKGAELKKLAELLELAPSDANRSGIYQTLAAQFLKLTFEGSTKDADTPANAITSRQDAALAQGHGHTAGVRRSSVNE